MKISFFSILILLAAFSLQAQKVNDATTPLHLLKPAYEIPYGKPEVKSIKEVLDRIYTYLDQTTPMVLINKETQTEVTDYSKIDEMTIFKPGDFRLVSYEWGVTYAGMLLVTEATGDPKYAGYTAKRLRFLAEIRPSFAKMEEKRPGVANTLSRVIHPKALDDAGAMCAAMIKTRRSGFDMDLNPMINNFIDYITTKEFRLDDGTLARNRPLANTLWLDDLFMSVPALAQMGKYTGDNGHFDDAVKQVLQFSGRMFNSEKGLFMHGWVMGMNEHPQYHWARANGWNAVASKVNAKGQVEGMCVGIGMAFDPAFYYYRPVSVYAAHGYGPVLLAGTEMIRMLKSHKIEINDNALQLYDDKDK